MPVLPSKAVGHIVKNAEAAMLSHRMLPPIHTWTGLRRARRDAGEQGSRKPAKPTTHWMDR
ncbi:hypothetical protein EYF80_037547 [Liparis tanakae]|uniref:Uncharacterized protein n=1 Tax=Liparis tanakae TaxID=230148 RepID=A0A4Z2GH74_9TELE|nr:hypothetical protein EYF80_037547 [Liparis tanakae]